MALYTIKWSETKKEGETNGRAWKITNMTLTDQDGKDIENVSTFEPVMTGGTIEGEIVAKGQYLNFEHKKVDNGKKPNMDRLMEKKSTQIAEAQSNKAQQIAQAQDRSAWMWAKTNASTLIANSDAIKGYGSLKEIADAVIELATKIYNGELTEPFASE